MVRKCPADGHFPFGQYVKLDLVNWFYLTLIYSKKQTAKQYDTIAKLKKKLMYTNQSFQ